jgi:ACS family hexuronate transporter-like MFS transporter
MMVFLGCGLLTAISIRVSTAPAGPALLAALLFIGAGALGLFPIYYSLTQELSARHQGKVTGSLSCLAWLATAVMHRRIGRWVDQTGSYTGILCLSGLMPLLAWLILVLFWDRRAGPGVSPVDPESLPRREDEHR